jgi:hypothetical protein
MQILFKVAQFWMPFNKISIREVNTVPSGDVQTPSSAYDYIYDDGNGIDWRTVQRTASTQSASTSASQLITDVVVGAAQSVIDIPVQATLQTTDLLRAGGAVVYNEIIRPFAGGSYLLPEMRSSVAQAYAQGTSHLKLAASSVPVANLGVFSYDTTSALMEGRVRDAARGIGGFMGGMAVGAGLQRYGSYGVQVGANGLGANLSNVRVSLVHPNLVGSGAKLTVNLGGGRPGFQSHHLIMSELAYTSPALRYLAQKGLYDVNRAQNGRSYPGNPLAAADSGLPLHRGYHGEKYRSAVAAELDGLNQLKTQGASDAALLARVARIENKLARQLETGRLWLNEADAMHRQLGRYAP